MRIQHYVKEGLADRKLGEFYQVFLLNFIHCRNNLWTSKEFIRKQVCRSYGSIEIKHYVYLQYRYFFSAVLRKIKLKKTYGAGGVKKNFSPAGVLPDDDANHFTLVMLFM